MTSCVKGHCIFDLITLILAGVVLTNLPLSLNMVVKAFPRCHWEKIVLKVTVTLTFDLYSQALCGNGPLDFDVNINRVVN